MSSIFSILSAGAPGQAPVAGQTYPLEPPGVAFETFLLTAQDRVEYPPAAAPATSTPPEARENRVAADQSDLQGDLSLESDPAALPSNGLLNLSLHPLAPLGGPADDDLTAWENDPTQGQLPASGPVLAQKGRPTASGAQEKRDVPDPLAALLSPSDPGEVPGKGGRRDREADPSGDGSSKTSFAPETPRTTPVFEEERNMPATEPSLFASSFALSRVEAPAQGRAARTETVERGREMAAQTAETGPSDAPSEGLLPPARALLHPMADPLPEEGAEMAGIVGAEADRPARAGEAGGDVRSPSSNARRDETAGDEAGDLLGDHPGQALVGDAREAALPDLTASEKPSNGSFETPPAPGPPQRKGTKAETLSTGMPSGDVSQNTPLSLLMQPLLPAPASGERAGEDSPPEMAGVQRPETRNPLPPPLAPAPERPAFAPVLEQEGPGETVRSVEPADIRAADAGKIGDRSGEETGAALPERVAGAVGDRPEAEDRTGAASPEAVVGGIGDRPGEEVRTAAPAQGTPDGKAEGPVATRPANAPVTPRKAPVAEAIGDLPQESRGREAGQAIGPTPDRPAERGAVRPSDVRADGKPAGSPARNAVRPSGAGTDDRPPVTATPLETQGRAAERAASRDREAERPDGQTPTTGVQRPETQGRAAERVAPFNREVERPDGQTRATGVQRPETQGRAAERVAPFNREAERPDGQTSTTGVQRPERREGVLLEGLSDPATSRAERAAPGERHGGKPDRLEAQEGARPTADQAIPFSSHLGDPVSLKTPPEYGPAPAASAQHQSAVSAAGPSPAGARVHTPAAASGGVPDPSPEAVVRQVIRGAHFLLKDDVSEVRVRLEPPELGSVHIRLVSGGDTLSGEIGVSNHDVKGIVESHLHQLRSSLTEQGLRVGHIDVSVRDDQRGGAWPDRTGGFGHPGNAPDDRRSPGRNGSPAWEAPEEDQRPRRSQSLVDYFA